MTRKITVLIQPIGHVDKHSIKQLAEDLNSKLEFFTTTISTYEFPLPKDAYNPLRKQYYSPIILKKLCTKLLKEPFNRILGVVDVDLYVKGLNFIFGEAQLKGKCAIISLYRLEPEFYGETENSNLFHERALKEAVHELGHTLGLFHCPNKFCVMHFSNSIWDTDVKSYNYCSKCKVKLMKLISQMT
ncbi:MAG: archemetzincin [Candidatus Methanomethylicota archaeon]|uniref:Archaemetzincin n=1 Tax=Thermoproteota archaeon TaxID=2056631 RepID=A0A497F3C9_9CREN|nr:MAG: archemetzincin [Candidatus Verstraetearchaeota archaeon]